MKRNFGILITLSLLFVSSCTRKEFRTYYFSFWIYNGTDEELIYERYFPAHNFPNSISLNTTPGGSFNEIRNDEIPSEDYCESGDWSVLARIEGMETVNNDIPDGFFSDYLAYASTFVAEPRLILYRASDRKELLNCRLDELDKYFRVVYHKDYGGEKPDRAASISIYLEGLPEETE